jgi:hypothetical protein
MGDPFTGANHYCPNQDSARVWKPWNWPVFMGFLSWTASGGPDDQPVFKKLKMPSEIPGKTLPFVL